MTALDAIQDWIATYPGHEALAAFSVDYTDRIPANGGIFPSGLIEISRTEDILGNVEVRNQYNFGLYYIFEKAPGDDVGAAFNADWVMDFQDWVQEQSIRGLTPTFGDKTTAVRAQNGVLYAADEEGTATYMVQLSVEFIKRFEVTAWQK